jgi:S-adenosylmethionine hydrolase
VPDVAIVTLTTDFGTADHYVAAMKAALLGECPDATLVDVTHAVPRQDVRSGAFTLERAVAAFPAGTVHLAVVDPGVGTERRLVVVLVNRSVVVCPDNGLITWAWRRHPRPRPRAYEVTWRPPLCSHTFHGRDVMAPVAGRWAAGRRRKGPPVDPLLLDLDLSATSRAGVIVHVDVYGNATTNVLAPERPPEGRWHAAGRDVGPLRRTYADVPVGRPVALVGSSGLVEVAVRDGSAADVLGLRVGDPVELL